MHLNLISLTSWLLYAILFTGIERKKKDIIVEKLVPLMPRHRRVFWIDMADSDAMDLITETGLGHEHVE